jgi:lysophospholipase L1-like esterase
MGPQLSYLALGDSYTIGECVEEEASFPYQLKTLLTTRGFNLSDPVIIAKTGWTTGELTDAIKETHVKDQYDLVTLLIGVNNQYRGYPIDSYRVDFLSLLEQAISFSYNGKSNVVVLSIPDWGASPYGLNSNKNRDVISAEIDLFNNVNREISNSAGVKYVDITPISKRGLAEPDLLAEDGLHPSGKMYEEWVKVILSEIEKVLK